MQSELNSVVIEAGTPLPSSRNRLNREFEERQSRNSGYSLRALSRDLAISHSFLSRYLRGEKRISAQKAFEIAADLNWSDQDRRAFVLSVAFEESPEGERRDGLLKEYQTLVSGPEAYHDLLENQHLMLKRWYYPALAELILFMEPPHSQEAVARRLGISKLEATVDIERLVHLGILAWSSKELAGKEARAHMRLLRCHPKQAIGDTPSATVRAFHGAMLMKGAEAIQKQPPESRHFMSMTIPADSQKIEEVRAEIRAFMRNLAERMGGTPSNSVYQASFQLFQLDQPERINQ